MRSVILALLVLTIPLRASARVDDAGPRLGLSVGRRVGGAVERNRVKRVLREAFWAEAERLPDTSDYVVVARPDARELAERGLIEMVEEAGDLQGALERALARQPQRATTDPSALIARLFQLSEKWFGRAANQYPPP